MSTNDVLKMQRLRAERSAAGLCIDCGREPRTDISKRGSVCGKKANARQKRYWKSLTQSIGGRDDEGEMTFEEIGAEVGLSRERVRIVYLRALTKLRRECDRIGIDPSDIIGRGFSSLALCERWASE